MMKMKTDKGDHVEKARQLHFHGQVDKRKEDELKYTSVFVLFTVKTQQTKSIIFSTDSSRHQRTAHFK